MPIIVVNDMFNLFSSRKPENPPGPTCQIKPGDSRIPVLVTVLNAGPDVLCQAIRDHSSKPGRRAIFVTTDLDVRPLMQSGLTFEYLPAPEIVRGFGDTGDWHGYLHESWRILHVKWVPRWVIDYGHPFNRYLEECNNCDMTTP